MDLPNSHIYSLVEKFIRVRLSPNCEVVIGHLQALFIIMYKSFSDVLSEPLRETEGSVHQSGEAEADEMAIEHEDTSAMELDNEGGSLLKRFLLKFLC